MAIKGTMIDETVAIRFMPPMTTRATRTATTTAVITVTIEYSVPKTLTGLFMSGSKNPFVAEAMPFT
jgi:hypothetical protein